MSKHQKWQAGTAPRLSDSVPAFSSTSLHRCLPIYHCLMVSALLLFHCNFLYNMWYLPYQIEVQRTLTTWSLGHTSLWIYLDTKSKMLAAEPKVSLVVTTIVAHDTVASLKKTLISTRYIQEQSALRRCHSQAGSSGPRWKKG